MNRAELEAKIRASRSASPAARLTVPEVVGRFCTPDDPFGMGHSGAEFHESSRYDTPDYEIEARQKQTLFRTNETLGQIFLGPFATALGHANFLRSSYISIRFVGILIMANKNTYGLLPQSFAVPPVAPKYTGESEERGSSDDVALQQLFSEYGRTQRLRDPDRWRGIESAAEKNDWKRDTGQGDTKDA